MAAKFGLLIDAKTKGENNIKRLGNSMQGVEGKAKNLGMAVKGVGLAFKGLLATAAVGGLVAIGKSAIDTADAFGKLSTRTGIAADKLLAYVNAGKLADVSQADLETGLRTLARTQVEASEGVKTYADAYAKLGIAVKNADGSLKPSDQLLGEIANKFQALPDGPEKAAVAMDIFGRSGQKMITMLNGGQESLERFGFELSENFARNSERFNDQITEMGIELQKLQMQVVDDLLPSLIDLANVFIDITKAVADATRAFLRFFNIGDNATLESNTLQIQAANKALAHYRKTLKSLREETTPNFARQGVIENIERTIAELERKREGLRNEINRITRVTPVADSPTPQRLDFVRPTSETSTKSAGLTEEQEQLQKLQQDYDNFKNSAYAAQVARDEAARSAVQSIQDEINIGQIRLEQGDEFADKFKEIRDLVLQGVPFSEAFGLVEAKANVEALQEEVDKAAAAQEQQANRLKELYKNVGNAITSSIGGAIEGLIFQTKSLGESLADLARSLARMFIQFGVQTLFGGIFQNAKGNVFAHNKIVPFAYGGVVNKPTLFPMANGMGIMGEAGPEAVMPLRRGRGGRLGVEASGGAGTNIVVNVDASGTEVQGDDNRGKQLGDAISAAIQAELVKQRRPGGLLSS